MWYLSCVVGCLLLILHHLFPVCFLTSPLKQYLALINRAGGLYGRIFTKVINKDWTQWDLYTQPRSRFSHTDRLSSVNKMFITWQKKEILNLFNVTGLCQLPLLLANDDEPNLILPKFACPLYFFSHQLFGTYRWNKYCQMKIVNDFAF